MCIYYPNREELTYTSREHVFPAGLGGKTKLELGMVSDQFNNGISKLEENFMRSSIFTFPRQFEGPGKYGSLSANKETKSAVLLSNLWLYLLGLSCLI